MFRSAVVTGGAGFIGSHLCRRLVEIGVEHVTAIDNFRSGTRSRVDHRVHLLKRDIAELSLGQWADIVDGSSVVFHLAAEKHNSSLLTPERLLTTNVLATERLIRAVSTARVGRLVFTSSLYAYGHKGPAAMVESNCCHPDTLYGVSKLSGESIIAITLRESQTSWNIGRLFFIFGPNQYAKGGYRSVINHNFERLLAGQLPTINGDGRQALDYVYIDDCIDALILLASSPTDRCVTNVASGKPISIIDLVEKMKSFFGDSIQNQFIERDSTHNTARWGDSAMAYKQFGWKASTPIEQGLEKTLEFLRSST